MNANLNESSLEQFALELLQSLGWENVFGPDIAPDTEKYTDPHIAWTIRESARAKLKVIVKRTLRKYGYPADMEAIATETVLKQAELIADEIISVGNNKN